MKNHILKANTATNIFFFILLCLSISPAKFQTFHDITEDVTGYTGYKKAEFSQDGTSIYYFKHTITFESKSKVTSFRFLFDQFDSNFKNSKIFCTTVDSSTSDAQLKTTLDGLTENLSSCIGDFSEDESSGIYDGIIKLTPNKLKLGIILKLNIDTDFSARIYLRTAEEILETKEQEKILDQSISLVPNTLVISDFRNLASKILFYSYTRELQMYYVEGTEPYPEKLFSGNILMVYTNPNQVRQKYKNANTMVLLTRPFSKVEPVSEEFHFQVKFYASSYLLDYFVSNSLSGRTKNAPLSINMTECAYPYYVVLNYNAKEKKIPLFIDQIYGKIRYLSVAPSFTRSKWESMIIYDMQEINISQRYYELPAYQESHIDVYKIECQLPLLLNFYYYEEQASIPKLDYGHIAIINTKAYQTYTLPFAQGISNPIVAIEVFNPVKSPFLIVDDEIISKNSLIKKVYISTSNPIVLKERNGDSNTRVIVKVGYQILGSDWEKKTDNIYYNTNLNLFVFYFPNDLKKLNYTYANLETIGTKDGDNIKYCYSTNIGAPILPSAENCFRVSLNNSYTLKVLNPLVMHRDYDFDNDIGYYVAIKPVVLTEKMDVKETLFTYDTFIRNLEGESKVIYIDTTSGNGKTILTAPLNKDQKEFVQIALCQSNDISFKLINAFFTIQTIIPETTIPSGTKNFYKIIDNNLLETELIISGTSGNKAFVRHSGIRSSYVLDIIENPSITFDSNTNQIILEHPINAYEKIEYTVYVGKEGTLSKQGITLCSIVENTDIASYYSKTVISYGATASISINFEKVGLTEGQNFEAIVYYEQKTLTKMAFLSSVFTDKVGKIKTDIITEINQIYSEDKDYIYATGSVTSEGNSLYFSYMPEDIRDVPVGAFRIELDKENTKSLSSVSCAFVDEDETASGIIEALEDLISVGNPYCIGGKSVTNGRNYNYIFKFSYTNDNKPRKLVIKITNDQKIEDGLKIYLRKGQNTYIDTTDFTTQKEYGHREEYQKTVMPYIVDLELIRNYQSEDNYVSKILFYSRYLDMQMYYLDETGERNMPMLFFTGNIILLYTKPDLAIQKYHSTKLILLSENLNGQEHSILGNNFRFHTKMFKSADQIEFYMSNNPNGRTLNYPLSVEINTCTSKNNKYYYILNYNNAEDERILYLDLLYGIMSKARVINKINSNYWNDLINNDFMDINDMEITLGQNSHHIDVVEIQCQTPLLINAYYTKTDEQYLDLKKGNIAIKSVPAKYTALLTLDPNISGILYCSISLYNPKGQPDMTFYYGTGFNENFQENSLKLSILYANPKTISIINNGNSTTRFIIKIGYGVEQETDWKEEKTNLYGALFRKDNKYVYKFPYGYNKKNFTNVAFLVKPLKKDTEELSPNTKFCYSTSIGNSIDTSRENCFRTGANIPYTLTFINPLIAPRNYKSYDDNYYITFSPFDASKYISLEITENKYDVEKRSMEGIPSVLNFENNYGKSIILSLPEVNLYKKIFIQLQTCISQNDNMTYTNLDAYSKEVIRKGKLYKNSRLYTYTIDNNKMESQIDFQGYLNDKVFVKHIGLGNTNIDIDEYSAYWIESKNTVNIVKPIKNSEPFSITVLVAEKGHFNDYSLCTFVETSADKYKTLGDYVATFISESSDVVFHYIDFSTLEGYEIGKEFDLLVYAVQINKAKIEVLYNIISGRVGKADGFEEIRGTIPKKDDYATQLFVKNTTSSNYLFYNFDNIPEGDIASLKIFSKENKATQISKVSCTLVNKDSSTEQMIAAINVAERTYNSLCKGQSYDDNGFDVLINTKQIKNGLTKLVILVKYGVSIEDKIEEKNDEFEMMNITIRTTGYKVNKENYEYNEDEGLTLVPYVIDLKEIREMQTENYHSKVLIYSSTRDLDMYYIQNASPLELFSGNIMMLYTNEDVIREKYNGASTMILLTDSLTKKKQVPFGEKFKFKVSFFNSAKTMQYYVSSNPEGRPLNNPTSIEMLNCNEPYYYILNYHKTEGDRMLHIDHIFGEINTTKFADQLTALSWDTFISEMQEFKGDEYIIKGQNKYHIDVFEVTCNTPLLLNVYYTDEANPKRANLQQGDISILTLNPNMKDTLYFIENLMGERFLYSFSIQRKYGDPDILIEFDNKDNMVINKNGIYVKNTTDNYRSIVVSNKKLSGDDSTKIYFKFGYNIDETFTKIENDIYNIQTENRTENLFVYIFKNGEDRLNYTKVDLTVTTTYDNVKFCYSTNLGVLINPSTQNCFRVGVKNNYTITVINPYIMYKNYSTGDNDNMEYFISFKTENKDLNITILPTYYKYDTINRNIQEIPKTLIVNSEEKTILTNPENKEYLFVQMDICSSNSALRFEFKNAFNGESLKENGEIRSDKKYTYRNIKNTKLDTELIFNTEYKDVNVFIKHTGLKEEFEPNIRAISIKYKDNKLTFNQPIESEEFKYTILLDKKDNLKNKKYSICSFTQNNKMAYYTDYITSSNREISYELDFENNSKLKGYELFDVLILAEEINNGKMMILSEVYTNQPSKSGEDKKTRNALIIVIVILIVACITGGVLVYLYLKKLKNRPRGAIISKPTGFDDIDSANAGEKLVESMAKSQALENQ